MPLSKNGIEILCRRHWDIVLQSRETIDPINGTAICEFLMRRFLKETEQQPTFKHDVENGMTPSQAQHKALANMAPICCLYADDMQELYVTCHYSNLMSTHPHMNEVDDPQRQHTMWFPIEVDE